MNTDSVFLLGLMYQRATVPFGLGPEAEDMGQRQDCPAPWGDSQAANGSGNMEKRCTWPLKMMLMKNL